MAKHKGSISIEQIYRNRFIFEQYEILRRMRDHRSIDEISRSIAKNCAMPSHFLSEQSAKVIYINYFNHGRLTATGVNSSVRPEKLALIESFIRCCKEVIRKTGLETASDICELANKMRCPTTGLSHYQIARILRSMGAH